MTKVLTTEERRFYRRVESAVRRGAAHLDRKRPGWYKLRHLTLKNLDLSDPYCCVLGQDFYAEYRALTGTEKDNGDFMSPFELGLNKLRLSTTSSIHNGFDLGSIPLEWTQSQGYDVLRELWKDQIRMRRARDLLLLHSA